LLNFDDLTAYKIDSSAVDVARFLPVCSAWITALVVGDSIETVGDTVLVTTEANIPPGSNQPSTAKSKLKPRNEAVQGADAASSG
jgi:hypothetical protein